MLELYKSIDRHYSSVIKEHSIHSRPGAGNGLWTAFLLPVIYSHTAWKAEWKDSFKNLAALSCWLTVLLLGSFTINLLTRPTRYSLVVTPALLILTSLLMTDSTFAALKTAVVAVVTFWSTFKSLLYECPRSFTLGEATVISQGISLAFSSTFRSDVTLQDYVSCGQSLLIGVGAFVTLVASVRKLREPLFFGGTFLATVTATVWLAAIKLEQNPVLWLYSFIIRKRIRVLLIGYWVFCTASSVGIVALQNTWKPRRELTIVRKYFHGVVVAVCLPGILLDLELLYLASTIALGAFVFLESVRICNIPPFGNLLTNALSSLLDEKDQGILILTHIYLLIGCCLPLWIMPSFPGVMSFDKFLLVASGVVTLGIGDTAASVGGTLFGRTKWPGSSKTVDGTVCSVVAQLVFGYVISIAGLIHSGSFPWTRFVFASIASSITEALTTQVDNLVLPLVMYIVIVL